MARQKKAQGHAADDVEQEIYEPTDTDNTSILDKQDAQPVVVGAGMVIEENIDFGSDVVLSTKENMLGDFVKIMADIIKSMPSIWAKMSDGEQQQLLDKLRWQGNHLITKAVEDIAANGRRIVTGTLKQVAIKDEITATILCARSPEACAAFGMASGGGPVAFLLLDTEIFLTDANPVKIDPKQPELPLDGVVEDEEFAEATVDTAEAFLGKKAQEFPDYDDDDDGCPL
ncbi:hypothetical protein [Candidatus Magnetaquicoccus inordinatus]|uniref:hypothetical protein n=1 Tax=Candidatus Magnetaquicoccus inordinatus TaxID=2496818 RepID=UPI00102C1F50|nr:hypothetical protein [Candidatus Magnetaquicoccus inordinatus]